MRYIYKSEQSGRSMVEMLGVLAIVGILSIGGIAGYSKAMEKYKISALTDQVSMLVANVRTLYSGQADFGAGANALTNAIAIGARAVPENMISSTDAVNGLINSFNGAVIVRVDPADVRQFQVEFQGLPRAACVTLLTADWGQGVQSLEANNTLQGSAAVAPGTDGGLPVQVGRSTNACNAAGNTNTVRWTYN